MPAPNTQYKTVGNQLVTRVWFPLQRSCRWTGTQPENPTDLYCQTLWARLTGHRQWQHLTT